MNIKSPIGWIGGKSHIAKKIISMFPEHKTFCEPFVGSGAVFFNKEPSKYEIINDLNGDLICLWKVIQDKDKLQKFCEKIDNMPISEQLFYEIRDKLAKKEYTDEIDRAVAMWYLAKTTFGALAIGTGEERFSGSYTMISRMNSFYTRDWQATWKRIRFAIIRNNDAIDIIKSYDAEDTLFYLDPPYIVATRNESSQYYAIQDESIHTRLCNVLRNIKGKFIMSYDNVDELYHMYDWAIINKISFKYYSSNSKMTAEYVSRKEKEELIITNYPVKMINSFNKWM